LTALGARQRQILVLEARVRSQGQNDQFDRCASLQFELKKPVGSRELIRLRTAQMALKELVEVAG